MPSFATAAVTVDRIAGVGLLSGEARVSSLIYFLVVTPAGLVYRLFRRDPLQRGTRGGDGSYWSSPRQARFEGGDFRRR